MKIETARLPVDTGPAGWNEILPPRSPAPELSGQITADWVVIGAGFAGLAAARRLRQLRPEDRVVVLEATRVACGPAGRNSGFMIDVPHDLASSGYAGAVEKDLQQIRLNRAAIDFAREAAQEYGLEGDAFRPCGKHNAAATAAGERHLDDYSRHLDVLSEPYERLDAGAMRQLAGTDFYRAGVFTPGTAMLQPAAFVRGMAAGLQLSGVDLYEQSPVTAIETGPDHVVHTPRGRVTAPRIILGVNGHAESFGFYRQRLLHVFTYASMTRELTHEEVRKLGGEPEWNITSADPMGTSIRRLRENRIVVRNRFTYEPSMEIAPERIQRVARDHDEAFRRRFPMLPGVTVDYRWGGRLCVSRNGVPAFGEVHEGVYSAVCQNGLGTTKGTFAGMAAAELATGTPSWHVDELNGCEPPRKLPPQPFMNYAANAYLRWHEHKARGE